MKHWSQILLGILIGLSASAVLFLIATPPRGAPVELLPAPTPAPILVQVDGAVAHPGVVSLPRDSRVQEAIQAAGGFSLNANPGAVNLAARLNDGDKLTVPTQGTPVPAQPAAQPAPGKAAPGKAKSIEQATPDGVNGGLVNLNTASLEELQTLPGIGESRAQEIIEYREAHGGFKKIEEIQNITGIGPATFEKLKDRITVE